MTQGRSNGHALHCTCSECSSLPALQAQRIVFAPVADVCVCGETMAQCSCPTGPLRASDAETSPEIRIGTGTELKDLALAFAMRIEELTAGGGELTLRIVEERGEEGPRGGAVVVECQNVAPLLGRALALGLRFLGRP